MQFKFKITQEQMETILINYLKTEGCITATEAELLSAVEHKNGATFVEFDHHGNTGKGARKPNAVAGAAG